MVITVMYRESMNPQPSITANPIVPADKTKISNTKMIRKCLGGRMPFTLVETGSVNVGSVPLPIRTLSDPARR
jgi:hypothetical protein